MDFLKYDLTVSNPINVQLNNYEVGPYSATTSVSDLHIVFLELTSYAILLSRIMSDS